MSGNEAQQLFSLPNVVQSFNTRGSSVVRRTDWNSRSIEEDLTISQPFDGPLHGSWWKAQLGAKTSSFGTHTKIRAVDLFSGSGGFAWGLKSAAAAGRASVQFLAAVDLDIKALNVHRANLGTENLFNRSVDDLVDYGVSGVARDAEWLYQPEILDREFRALRNRVDIVLAGPPCQGNSNLNNRTRHDDNRNRLYLTIPAVTIALQAPAAIIENVPGVVHDRSQVVQSTIALFERGGYSVSTATLDASKLGWPQTRKRFFLVATRDPEPVSLAHLANSNSRKALNLRWAISEFMGRNDDPLLDGIPTFSEENRKRMDFLVGSEDFDMPNEIRPSSHRNGNTYKSSYGRMRWDEASPTITTGFVTPGRGRFIHPDLPRTITAREAARIQGFPDDFFRREVLESVGANRGALAKWIGDAVPLPLGEIASMSAISMFV